MMRATSSSIAKNVVRRSLHIQPKENVIVECWNHGLDAAKEIVYQLRAVGARPMLLLEDEETHWRSVEDLPPTKLGQVSASEWAALAKADAYVFFPGPADIARYRKNMEKSQAATSYNSDWYRRAERAGLRGARVLLGYVSRERARSYGFEFDAWREMILRASSVDFNAIARKGKKLAALLSKDAEVEVSAPNGTRFVCELKGRTAQSDDGIVDAQDVKDGEFMTNVPPGYVIVCPGETSAEGIVRFDRPVPYLGLQVTDVAFQFKDGKATWSAGTNEESIRSQYDRATGAKDRLGWLQIGLNPAASYGFLQDDLVAGAIEIGIGDNSEYGGEDHSNIRVQRRLSNAAGPVGEKILLHQARIAAAPGYPSGLALPRAPSPRRQRARGADGPRVSRLAASARLPESELFEARRAERDDPPDLAPGSRRFAGARRRAARHLDRPVALVRILGVGRGPSAGLGARGRHNRNRNPRPARSAHDDCEGGLV